MGKLTQELRRVLKLQYPEDTVIEVKGEIVHFKDTADNWEKLAKGLGLEIYKESIGNKNWVLYNPKNFKVVKGNQSYLKCISEENLEMPINCSSCYCMFYNFKFDNKDAIKDFDISGVRRLDSMFRNCKFPNGFSLGDKFDTSNAKSMDGMFLGCSLPDGFSLGAKFDTSSVRDMTDMFYGCILPISFSLGDKFDTSNVESMLEMFRECDLPEQFSLGDKFDISNVKDMRYMFASCKLPEGKTEEDFNRDYKQIVEWLKSRNPKNSNNTSNTNFFKQ